MRILCAMALLAALVACGGGDTADDIAGSADSDDLVVRIDVGGGLMPREAALSNLPTVSVYADGRVITQGPQIAIYPSPALPNLLVSEVSEEGLERIGEAARDAGLDGPDRHYENPTIADAPTTTFLFVDDEGRHVTSVEALEIGPEPPAEIRDRLVTFRDRITGLRTWLGEDAISEEQTYEPEAMAVYVIPPMDTDPEVPPNELEWPLGTPLSAVGEEIERPGASIRCGVVSGDDLDTLLERAREATQITRWISEGEARSLVLRPLLPDESSCPAAD